MSEEVDFGLPFNFKAYFTRGIIWGQRKVFSRMPDWMTDHKPIKPDFTGEAANEYIKTLLRRPEPCLVARFGCGEFEASMRGFDKASKNNRLVKWLKILCGKSGPFWWDNSIRLGLVRQAGVFPTDDAIFDRFAARSLEDSRQYDLIATWNAREKQAKRLFFPQAKAFPITDFDPFFYEHPWTAELKGKRVLVIHPFIDTIREQYPKRRKIFANPEMLPDFDLITYRSVTSFLGIKTPYKDWFEALEKQQEDIAKIDFDVALLGCGAYGLSLGAFIKRDLKRKAVHMGGCSQLLFGIRGGRWDADPKFAALANSSWCRTLEHERPGNYKQHEGGAYW